MKVFRGLSPACRAPARQSHGVNPDLHPCQVFINKTGSTCSPPNESASRRPWSNVRVFLSLGYPL
jgi:hypothetical protein